MGLTFLHPLFLLGTLAATVPVILHLMHRRRALVHRFPAVRFLLLADKRTARKFRLHQWLLLALRVLAILLLALLLARPRLVGKDAYAAVSLPSQATIILVDNSLSMQYRDGQTSRLQRAKELSTRLLQKMRPRDHAAVLPLLPTAGAESPPAFLGHDPMTWQAQLTAIRPSHAAINMVAGLQHAFTLLQASPTPRRKIVLLSDFTTQGWDDFHLSRLALVPENVELHFIRLGSAQRDANTVVEEVRLVEKPFIEHVPIEITALVRNRSAVAVRNLQVDLLLGQHKSGEQLVDIDPEAQVAVPFRITAPPAGLHWGEVRLESDRFAPDDHFYYALRTVAPVHVLVVDGDPGASLVESDTFYLLSALQPAGALGRLLFYPTPVTWEGLERERFSAYQIVVLCNVEALAPQIRRRLHQFVVEGGGLLFFTGNRVKAAQYNAMFYRSDTLMLPLPLAASVPQRQAQPLTIGSFDGAHDALAIFAGEEALLQRGKFYRYTAVEEPQPASDAHVVLTLQNGQPLLVEKGLGRGRIMFFASSADRDWTDLPTRTAYVPLLHGLMGYLANLSAAAQRPGTIMPAPVQLLGRAGEVGATLTFLTPDGQERLSRYSADGTRVVARFTAYTVPGIYRITTPSGLDFLAGNATRAESQFAKLQLADLRTKFRPLPIVLEEEETLGQANADNQLPLKELSGTLLLTLAAVLMVENVCANRF